MSAQWTLLRQERHRRQSAWREVREDVRHLRADLRARSVGERIGDRAKEKALHAAAEASGAALRHRGLVAAGAAAVVLWFGLGPLTRTVRRLFADTPEPDEQSEPEDDQEEKDT